MADKREMTDEHKAALAEGRKQGKAVRGYLEALEKHKPKRGRKRTPESMRAQLDKINSQIDNADPVKKLQLIQERMDLQAELDAVDNKPDMSALEAEFVAAAKGYSERKTQNQYRQAHHCAPRGSLRGLLWLNISDFIDTQTTGTGTKAS